MLAFEDHKKEPTEIAFVYFGDDFKQIAESIGREKPEISKIGIGSQAPALAVDAVIPQTANLIFFAFNYRDLAANWKNLTEAVKILSARKALFVGLGVLPPIKRNSMMHYRIRNRRRKFCKHFSAHFDFDLNKVEMYRGQSSEIISRSGYYGMHKAVIALSNIVSTTGFVNIDFADVNLVLRGKSVVATGYGSGEDRINKAIFSALQETVLQESPKNARCILINVVGGIDFNLAEYHNIQKYIFELASKESIIIVGFTEREGIHNTVSLTIIFSSFDLTNKNESQKQKRTSVGAGVTEIEAEIDHLISTSFPSQSNHS